jgi:hypothetical protein
MAHAQRIPINSTVDTAMATVVGQIPSWVSNGGSASVFVRSINAALAAADPTFARYVQRHLGSSLLAGVKTTITLADRSP